MDDSKSKSYKCTHCIKQYTTYASLWTHNKHHHPINTINKINICNKQYNCSKCNKKYGYNQSKKIHEKTCIGSGIVNNQLTSIELEIEKTKLEQIKMQIKLQKMLQKSSQINATTIKAINKMLIARTPIINITTTNNNNNYFVGIGKEDVLKTISDAEKWEILNSGMDSLENIVNIVHCGNYGKFHNALIMNLKDNTAYRFDDKLGYFVLSNKKELIDELVNSRIIDIENIYNTFSTELLHKQNENTNRYIQRFIESINNEDTEFLSESTKFANFKLFKIDMITKILYNNHDKIKQNIAHLINNDIKENENI